MHMRSLGLLALLSTLAIAVLAMCKPADAPPAPPRQSQLAEDTSMFCDGVTRTEGSSLSKSFLTDDCRAVAFKASEKVADGGLRVRLRLSGKYELKAETGVVVTVTDIIIFGDLSDQVDTNAPCDVLHSLTMPRSTWSVARLDAEWDGASKYQVTVRYLYDRTANKKTTHHFEDQVGSFTVNESGHADSSEMSRKPGEVITSAFASGSFFSTAGIAMYDVRVQYNGKASAFEVRAGPVVDEKGNANLSLIHTEIDPTQGGWAVSGIEGAFSDDPKPYDQYRIEITQIDESGKAVSTATGDFLKVHSNGAAQFASITPHS